MSAAYGDIPVATVKRTSKGELRLFNPAHATSLIVMVGHMELAHAEAIVDFGEELIDDQEGIHASFHDYLEMSTYDSEARIELTRWGKLRRDRVRDVHVVQSSRIVAMGVATAGLALSLVGTKMHSYVNRDRFLDAFRKRCASVD